MNNSNRFDRIGKCYLSEDFGPYRKGVGVTVHQVEFFQGRFYALAEMPDGELRTMEMEYFTTGGEWEHERRRQKEALTYRPDLTEDVETEIIPLTPPIDPTDMTDTAEMASMAERMGRMILNPSALKNRSGNQPTDQFIDGKRKE